VRVIVKILFIAGIAIAAVMVYARVQSRCAGFPPLSPYPGPLMGPPVKNKLGV